MIGFGGRADWSDTKTATLGQITRFNSFGGSGYGEASRGEVQVSGMFRVVRNEGRVLDPSAAAALLLRSWSSGGLAALANIAGHYAVAIWHDRERCLTLLRSPLSPLPLCVRYDSERAIFGSKAVDLYEADQNLELSVRVLAGRLTGTSLFHQISLFPGVATIAPGTALSIDPAGRSLARFWDPVGHAPVVRSDEAASTRLREALDQAVASAMDAFSGPIACHLSAGRDSAAVTSAAAFHDPSRVIAFTSAPDASFPQYWDRFALDESPEAAGMAAALGIEHRIIRNPATDFCAQMDALHKVQNVPMGTPINLPWWEEVSDDVAKAGGRVLLNGDAGNLTISMGGPRFLPDVLRRSGPVAWWRAFREAARSPHASARNLLKFTFAPFVPLQAYRVVERLANRTATVTVNPFLAGDLRRLVEAEPVFEDSRPVADQRLSWQVARRDYDPSDLTPEAAHGIVMIDPTADLAVVTAALDLTDDQLMSPYHQRTIFDLAFGDRLETTPGQFARRGIQSADWNHTIDPDNLAAGLRRYCQHSLVEQLLDTRGMEEAIKRWPTQVILDGHEKIYFANHLLEALALASFIWVHNPTDLAP